MAFVGIYRALYDYHPQSSEELEIRDGDLLFVLEKSADDDWWKCKKKAEDEEDDEPEGLVPNNYVEEAKVLYQAKALYDAGRVFSLRLLRLLAAAFIRCLRLL